MCTVNGVFFNDNYNYQGRNIPWQPQDSIGQNWIEKP